jgi:hypothetical protein
MTAVPQEQTEDGDLIGARRRLSDAISKLTDPRPEVIEGQTHWLDSIYTELREALPGEQGSGYAGVARSLPPLHIDAADLLNEIDIAVSCWEPRPNIDASEDPDDMPHMTVIRLRSIEKHGCRGQAWRPQDASKADQIATNIQQWVQSIDQLLRPPASWSLPDPCPACGAKIVHRKDSAGDLVRKPALSISGNGCECLACRHVWTPQYFTHLGRVLGYQLPAGVLE